MFIGSPYWPENVTSSSSNAYEIPIILTYTQGGKNPYATRITGRLLQGSFDWE